MAESRFDSILRELRRERKLTQKDVADAIDVTASTLSGYEVGTKTPTLPVAMKLADFFNVSLDYLCGKTSDRNDNDISGAGFHTQNTPITKYLKDIAAMCELFRIHIKYETIQPDFENGFEGEEYEACLKFKNSLLSGFIVNYSKLKDLHENGALSDELYELSINGLIDKYKDFSVFDAQESDEKDNFPF